MRSRQFRAWRVHPCCCRRLVDGQTIKRRMLLIDYDEIVTEIAEYFGGMAARRFDESRAELLAGDQAVSKCERVIGH
jgi:hypothetical protein